MELDSEEAVTWFAGAVTRKRFLKKLHPVATIKPRLYQVMVQFVPLTFQPDREVDLHEVEEANSIDIGGIEDGSSQQHNANLPKPAGTSFFHSSSLSLQRHSSLQPLYRSEKGLCGEVQVGAAAVPEMPRLGAHSGQL